jgi:hypothetical protein
MKKKNKEVINMENKLVKVAMAIVGIGYVTRVYGEHMYKKGLMDADTLYRPMLDTDHKLIHALVDKLQKAGESQK